MRPKREFDPQVSEGDPAQKRLGSAILYGFSRGLGLFPKPGRLSLSRLLKPTCVPDLGLLALSSALCGTCIVYVLNKEASLVQNQQFSILWALLFVLVLIAYRAGQKALISRTSSAIEQALDEWRCRISEKVARITLRDTEELSRGRLLDGMSRSYEQLTQTIVPLVAGLEAVILLACMLAYLVTLSVVAGLMTVVVAGSLVIAYLNIASGMQGSMAEAREADAHLARLSEDMVDGFKELKLSDGKLRSLLKDTVAASGAVAKHRSQTSEIISQLISTGNSASFLLAGSIVFLLPILSGYESGISRIVTAVLFLLGPIGGVVGAAQQYATARFAIGSIKAFEERVDNRLAPEDDGPDYTNFHSIVIAHGNYNHLSCYGEPGFGVHDISATFVRGEIIFITGANGSGKTTALRLLTGLYPLKDGSILIDGQAISNPPPQSYRNLFATVFADYHIFAKAYGLDDEGYTRLERSLNLLQVRDKLPANLSEELNRDALSTGQQKRLALGIALAEDRPVLLLDEWAADQDPETRERFYREILPELKKTGKTIIAVTHDERYFDCADRRYHMDEGRLEQVLI